MADRVEIRGLAELAAKLKAADPALYVSLREKLKVGGKQVAGDTKGKLASLAPTAGGVTIPKVGPRVRKGLTITVEQGASKTTGKRPDWGATQMRYAFVPALDEDHDAIVLLADEAVAEALKGVNLT